MLYVVSVNKPGDPASTSAQNAEQQGTETDEKREDRELVSRARSGDSAAFKQLFERYHRRAFAVANGVVRNPQDALDLVQDAFVKAYRNIDKFEGNSSFYTWLYRIVMNLSIDHIRKVKRVRAVDWSELSEKQREVDIPTSGEDGWVAPKAIDDGPGKSLLRKELRAQLNTALSEMSENHRAVLVMRELDGMSYDDMAQAMKCSKGTIMSRLFHARRNMQKRLIEMRGEGDEIPLGAGEANPNVVAQSSEISEKNRTVRQTDHGASSGERREGKEALARGNK